MLEPSVIRVGDNVDSDSVNATAGKYMKIISSALIKNSSTMIAELVNNW